MRAALILVLAASSLAACGGAKAGGSCSQTGFLCQDKSNALECLGGTWTALPCRGTGGCAVANSQVTCDMSADMAGDACASSAEGLGLCTVDGHATLECRGGTLQQTNTCTSCAITNGQVVCQQ